MAFALVKCDGHTDYRFFYPRVEDPVTYGLLTIYLRVCKQSAGLGKLEKMKELYGERLPTLSS